MSSKAPDRLERFFGIVSVAVLLTGIGAATYAFLRLSYLRFYSYFAITPEDVGVTQMQMLAGLLRTKATRYGSAGFIFLLAELICLLLIWRRASNTQSTKAAWQGLPAHRQQLAVWLLIPVVIGTVPAGFGIGDAVTQAVHTRAQVRESACYVRQGEAITSSDTPFISVQVVRAEVAWINDKVPPPRGLVRSTTLMYLGRANGRVVLYDRAPQVMMALSLPEADVLLRLTPPKPISDSIKMNCHKNPNQ